jgi:hypothetical protein
MSLLQAEAATMAGIALHLILRGGEGRPFRIAQENAFLYTLDI